MARIPDRLYFRIGDVAELAGVKPYVLRYWESEFPMISPTKSGTGQRVYRRGDVETVLIIKHLLYVERYSIEGARKRLRQLRKEGEIPLLKKAVSGGQGAGMDEEKLKQIRGLVTEIQVMARTPLHQIFPA
jgi:DNA-binding transcriptional MerR regulator